MSASITAITMPKWGLTMTEGKVVAWLKPQGSSFTQGEELLEIETSKIINVMEAEADGTLVRIVAPEGSTLPIGALLAVVAPATTAAADIDAFIAEFVVPELPEDQSEADGSAVPRDLVVAGQRLRYLEMGSGGVPILLLHGFGADLNSWMFTQPALAESHRTIALDLPGHGGSSKNVGVGDIDSLADTVAAALGEFGIERANLVGHSMGGAVAAALAVRRPDQAATLTLVASACLGREINSAFINGFIGMARRKDAEAVLRLLVHDPGLLSCSMVEDVLRYKRIDDVPAALETIAAAWFAGGRQVANLVQSVCGLATPVQLIWGHDDQIIPVAHAEALASRLPAHILADAGHLPHMEKSATVNQLIRRFTER